MSMQTWQLQEAKARLSELIDTAERSGPQLITRRGKDTAVVVPVEEWNRVRAWQRLTPPTPPELPTRRMSNADLLKLLQSAPDFEIPDRHAERPKRRHGR